MINQYLEQFDWSVWDANNSRWQNGTGPYDGNNPRNEAVNTILKEVGGSVIRMAAVPLQKRSMGDFLKQALLDEAKTDHLLLVDLQFRSNRNRRVTLIISFVRSLLSTLAGPVTYIAEVEAELENGVEFNKKFFGSSTFTAIHTSQEYPGLNNQPAIAKALSKMMRKSYKPRGCTIKSKPHALILPTEDKCALVVTTLPFIKGFAGIQTGVPLFSKLGGIQFDFDTLCNAANQIETTLSQ